MNKKYIGDIAEYKFGLLCLEKSWNISKPLSNMIPYDWIVDTGKNLYKIQVKASSTIGSNLNNFKANVSKRSENGKRIPYKNYDFDYAAIYLISLDIWYIIPITALRNISSINLFPNVKNSKGQYEMYKENWKL